MSKFFGKGKKARKASKKKQNLQLEALENRILLSADLGITANDLQQPEGVEVIASELQLDTISAGEFEPQTIAVDNSLTRLAESLVAETEGALDIIATEAEVAAEVTELSPELLHLMQQSVTKEIIILDAAVPQLESVINELFANSGADIQKVVEAVNSGTTDLQLTASPAAESAGSEQSATALIGLSIEDQLRFNAERDVKVFVLNAEQDGVEQISSILDYFNGVAAIHLLSHGSAGALFLGNTQLNNQQLRQNQQQLKRWGNALTTDGDLLLYGCDVAGDAEGIAFIEQLAVLTGADVAASDDDTGNAAAADWDLEQSVGQVETSAFISAAMLDSLDTTGTDGDDTVQLISGTATGLKGDDVYKITSTTLPTAKITVTESKAAGNDTLDLSAINEALTITIKSGNRIDVSNASGVKISATNVENIIGGKQGDTFIVEKGATLKGYIDGGLGTNILKYTSTSNAYTSDAAIDFSVGTLDSTGRASSVDGFAVGGVKNIQQAVGGKGDDILRGSDSADNLTGGLGADDLYGGDGADTLIGGAGDDTYYFSGTAWGGDTITELLNGGSDALSFQTITSALNYSIASTGITVTGSGQTLSSVDNIEKLVAGKGANTFTFANNWADKVVVDATTGATVDINFAAVSTDLYFTIKANGTVEVADVATRTGGHRAIIEFVDNIIAGTGTNYFIFEAGANLPGNLTGGAGTNVLDYSKFNQTVDLINLATIPGVTGTLTAAGSGVFEVVGSAKQDLLDVATGGTTLSGMGGNDYLIGDASADTLSGGKGNDIITGAGGVDALIGNQGDDTYYVSDAWGTDTITELRKEGSDTISFAGMDAQTSPVVGAITATTSDLTLAISSAALTVTGGANTLTAATDSFPYIETLIGGEGDNSYTFANNWGKGTASGKTYYANKITIDDTNTAVGKSGTLNFSAVTSDLVFTLTESAGVTTVTVTTVVSGKQYKVIATGIENITGGTGENTFVFKGAATLPGTLTGYTGAGSAVLDFSKYASAVTVDLSTVANGATTAAGTLIGTIAKVNDLIGSDYADTLTGDDLANTIDGGDEVDTISGNGGVDMLKGGAGDDVMTGGAGNDTLIGGSGADDMQGGLNDDTYTEDSSWVSLGLGKTDTITDNDGNNILDLSAIKKDLQVTFTAPSSGTGTNVSVAVELPLATKNKINISGADANWDIKTGGGDDTVTVTSGALFNGDLDTGTGVNTLDYYNGTDGSNGYKTAVTVDLSADDATGFGVITGIRDVYGSDTTGGDTLTGDDQDNTFFVGRWTDATGNEHTIDGGTGNNTVSFDNFSSVDLYVDLSVLDAGNTFSSAYKDSDTGNLIAKLSNIVNLIGGGGADQLIGDDNANRLEGGDGADILEGGLGSDVLVGGADNDTLRGGDGDDTYLFGSGWGQDDIEEALDEGKDVLDFAGVAENITVNIGRQNANAIDIDAAVKNAISISDGGVGAAENKIDLAAATGGDTRSQGFNVEKFTGLKDTDTLEQANVTLTADMQDQLIAGLEALKAVVENTATLTDLTGILNFQVPLLGNGNDTLGDLLSPGAADADAVIATLKATIVAELDLRIAAMKSAFWLGDLTANDTNDSDTDTLLALTDDGLVTGNKLFSITPNTRLLEVGTSFELASTTQSLGLDLGSTLSEIPGLDVDLSPNVTATAGMAFAVGVVEATSQTTPEYYIADPALSFDVSIFDDQLYAGMDLGLIKAAIGGPDAGDPKGVLALDLGLALSTDGIVSSGVLSSATLQTLLSLEIDTATGVTADLPVVVDTTALGIDLPSLPVISLSTPTLPSLGSLSDLADFFALNMDWELPDLSDILDLSNISIEQLLSMLSNGLGFLVDNFDFNLKIPGIDLSLDDIFGQLPGIDGIEDMFADLRGLLDGFNADIGLQGLEVWLNDQLAGLMPTWPTVNLPSFDLGWDGFNLDIDFDFNLNLDDILGSLSLPFDLDLADLGLDDLGLGDLANAINISADGELAVDAELDMAFDFQVAFKEYAKAFIGDSATDIQSYIYLGDNTGINLDASISGNNLNAQATIDMPGAIPDIGFVIAGGAALASANANVGLNASSDGRYSLRQLSGAAFNASATGEATIDLPIFLGITDAGVGFLPMGGTEGDFNGDGYADNLLHASFGFGVSNTGGFTTDDLMVVKPGFGGFGLLQWLDNPQNLLDGLGGFFDGIDDLADSIASIEIPLIGGEQFISMAESLRDMRTSVMGTGSDGGLQNVLQDMVDNNETQVSSVILGALRQELFEGLKGIDNKYLSFVTAILDENGEKQYAEDGKILTKQPQSADDIQLLLNADGELTFNLMFGGTLIGDRLEYNSDGNLVAWDGNQQFVYNSQGAKIVGDTNIEVVNSILDPVGLPIDFSVGLPGLGLDANADINTTMDYLMGLGLGLSITDGVFLDTSGINESGEEIAVDIVAELDTGNGAITGTLGFLQMDLTGVASLAGHLGVDLTGGGDGRLTLGETLGLSINASAIASADIQATASTLFDFLPTMSTGIEYEQILDASWNPDSGASFELGDPDVWLRNVQLDAGSIMGSFLGESLSIIKEIIEPMRPVIDLLTMELDLGIAKLMMIDMAYLKLPAKTVDTAKKVIQIIKSTIEFIDAMDSIGGIISFGDFHLTGNFLEDPNSQATESELGANRTGPTGGNSSTSTAAAGPDQKGLAEGPVKRFRLPILEDPATALGLITGKPVDLFWYDLPDLDLEFTYKKTYPVYPGLNVGIIGSVGVETFFDFGFDTSGFIEFQESGYATSEIWRIMNGFYLDDHGLENTANDLDEVVLSALLGAIASLGVGGLVEAGVMGGIEAKIGFDLNDKLTQFDNGDPIGDGKFYGSELIERISHGPQCLFDVHGTLTLFLDVFLWIGIDLGFSEITLFEATERFVDILLAEFKWECVHAAPEHIAEKTGDVLELKYYGDDSAGAHAYTVKQLNNEDTPNWTIETLFKQGFLDFDYYTSTELSALSTRLTSFDGEDILVVSTGQRVEVYRASEIKKITTQGTASDDHYRISGVDEYVETIDLNTGGGSDLVEINLDDKDTVADAINGITISSGSGNDIITVNGGVNDIIAGNIIIDAGSDDDRIKVSAAIVAKIIAQGGSGNDSLRLDGEQSNYTFFGAFGGNGRDTIMGGDNTDFMYGDSTLDLGQVNAFITAAEAAAAVAGAPNIAGTALAGVQAQSAANMGGADVLLSYGGKDYV
ncbi:MAG: DUF4347 domain-containing protein, partial [Amphritea sp.]|nr:DUF4347 domain-containing protein [Amphritea sp.]